MYLITERDRIKAAIKNFISIWGEHTYPADKRGIKVGFELSKLNSDTCTAEEVNNLIGNDWVSQRCSECGSNVNSFIQVGEELDYESRTVFLCHDCVTKIYNAVNN